MLESPFSVCLTRVLPSAVVSLCSDCSGPGVSSDVKHMEVVLEERAE